MKSVAKERFFVLYIPWLLSALLASDPVLSYFIAWLGSFFILYITLSGWVRPIPKDLTMGEQLMRPIFLVQIIFAGYMCCTTIFYFFSVLGYVDFHKINDFYLVDQDQLQLTAQCQRYYCLAHAAFISGVLIFMDYSYKRKYYVEQKDITNLLFYFAIITLPLSNLFLRIPGLSQFYNQFSSLSFIAGTLALAFAIPQKKIWNTAVCILLYLFNFYQALISGFKEPIIISTLVLAVFLYPNYKKIVLIIFVPFLILLFILLPTYNRIFRQNAWSDDVDVQAASQLALDATLDSKDSDNSNWTFLTYRLSEVDMFTEFIKSTPEKVDFYHFQILEQSAIALVPRIFWSSKPITEELVMERVYNAGVINRGSNVSAKPPYVVDAYLSYGGIGVFIFLFIYGATAQLISIKAEKLFGGYILGTALIFSGLFQIMWRGLSFEFIINTVFWSYVSMLAIQKILIATRILKPA
ncbi:MAG TPA: hypothetical protein VGM63_10855 [Mucilaginibacter sp.]|jgi:hypothetical protein